MADDQAAALPIPAVTALRTVDLFEVTAGQHVVVVGATGGVGGHAVQIARSRGAHVIATGRGDADEARRLGSGEVYDSLTVDVIDALHAHHPDGVDAVLDLVNGRSPSPVTPRSSGPADIWSRPPSRRTKAGLLTGRSLPSTTPPARIP